MYIVILSIISLLKVNIVIGIDTNSMFPRTNCYPGEQEGCCQDLTEAYPELSMSATNLTVAETYFFLFTRNNPDNPEKLHKCGGRLPNNTNYNPNNRLIITFSPFTVGYCDVLLYREWTTQILIREDANVIAVDSSWGNKFDYATAMINAKIVAKQTVVILKNIKEDKGLTNSRIYLIGHSLGAQTAGLIGYMFKVGRITGIDPAGPGYAKNKTCPKDRLDPSDADLVDVWHSNMGDCLPQNGINYDAGHVDFYINGGRIQEGCQKFAAIALLRGEYMYGVICLIDPNNCSHGFAAELFKVSINPGNCQFVGVKCHSNDNCTTCYYNNCGVHGRNCIIMGFDLEKYYVKPKCFPQRYYVKTSMDCPYCITNTTIQLQGFKKTYRSSLQSK